MIRTKLYLPADLVILSGERLCAEDARLNQIAGPAFTIVDNGRPIACGGIRIDGVGEAWCVLSEQARNEKLKSVMKIIKSKIDEYQREEKLYKMFAVNVASENFLRHLGFVKNNNVFER